MEITLRTVDGDNIHLSNISPAIVETLKARYFVQNDGVILLTN